MSVSTLHRTYTAWDVVIRFQVQPTASQAFLTSLSTKDLPPRTLISSWVGMMLCSQKIIDRESCLGFRLIRRAMLSETVLRAKDESIFHGLSLRHRRNGGVCNDQYLAKTSTGHNFLLLSETYLSFEDLLWQDLFDDWKKGVRRSMEIKRRAIRPNRALDNHAILHFLQ